MAKRSDDLRREYHTLGKSYPGDRAAAQQQLRLARECAACAHELDPSLRQAAHRMALDEAPAMALDEATIDRMVARAMRVPRKETTMRRPSHTLDTDALFQRDPDSRDLGPAFRQAWDSRFTPRPSLKERLLSRLMAARTRLAQHAFDSADRDEAMKQIKRIKTHLALREPGSPKYDAKYVADCFDALAKALGEEEDAADTGDPNERRPGESEEEFKDRLWAEAGNPPPDGREADDGVGETPARSVVELGGGRTQPDHRRDFNDIPAGDSALFDADALLQRTG